MGIMGIMGIMVIMVIITLPRKARYPVNLVSKNLYQRHYISGISLPEDLVESSFKKAILH